jgi:hypothetical protein
LTTFYIISFVGAAYDIDDLELGDAETMEEGASAAVPDDAISVFTKHTGKLD